MILGKTAILQDHHRKELATEQQQRHHSQPESHLDLTYSAASARLFSFSSSMNLVN
jgi:hypothetical protein